MNQPNESSSLMFSLGVPLYFIYCIVLCLFNVSFYNSGCSLIQTNIKQFQGLHKALHLMHEEHVHLFSWNQILIRFLNCLAFWAVLISSGSEFQIFGPWKLSDLIPKVVVLTFGINRGF